MECDIASCSNCQLVSSKLLSTMSKPTFYDVMTWFLLAAIICLTFGKLFNTFYQQDEWMALGHNLAQGASNVLRYSSPLQLILGEGRPLGRALNLIFLGVFQFTVWPLVIFAIGNQIINAILVYSFTNQLSGNRPTAVIAAAFFAVNGVAHQAVSWGAAVATLPATTCILLALIQYAYFLKTKKMKYLYWAFGLTLVSLLFKEVGIFLLLLLPLLHYLYTTINTRRASLWDTIKTNLLFLGYGVVAVVFRFFELSQVTTSNGAFTATGAGFKEKIVSHLILYPLTGIWQIFVPALPMYDFSKHIAQLHYSFLLTSPLADLGSQTMLTDLLCVMGAVIVLGVLLLLNYVQKHTQIFYISTAVLITTLSFLPYAVLDRGGSYMDSRYYYVAAIGGGMLLGYLGNYLIKKNIFLAFPVIIGLVFFIYQHGLVVRQEIAIQTKTAAERIKLLSTLKKLQPDLMPKTVFYFTGNKEYYIATNKLPMQQGMGYTLLVWYYSTKKIPSSLLNENFLWNLGDQGYKEVNGTGFGFFSEKAALLENYQKYKLTPEQVVSFNWDGKTQELIDTSLETRKLLQ